MRETGLWEWGAMLVNPPNWTFQKALTYWELSNGRESYCQDLI